MNRMSIPHLGKAAAAVLLAQSAWPAPAPAIPAAFRQSCAQCHGKAAMGGINLAAMTTKLSIGDHFAEWEKVVVALETKRMPPANTAPLPDADRAAAVRWVRARMSEYAERNAGDPGRVTMRRLTSGEYLYAIKDLTGLDLRLDGFVPDSVGGEGFTNFGDVQFMQDAALERYLEAGKLVAGHAVIGSGPLGFFPDPGKSGFELSAINRVQEIYTANGFRAASGEGGKPYGLDRYSHALLVAWRYRHRAKLGQASATLEALAAKEKLSPQFARHIWTVLHEPDPGYPLSDIVSRWNALPAPTGAGDAKAAEGAQTGCRDLQKFLIEWPRWLLGAGGAAEGGQGDERALVLTDESVKAETMHRFRTFFRAAGQTARVHVSAVSANPNGKDKPYVIWRNATVRVRNKDRSAGQQTSLFETLDAAQMEKLGFGKAPDGTPIGEKEFALAAGASTYFDLAIPGGAGAVELMAEGLFRGGPNGDGVLRCTLSDRAELATGRPISAVLGDEKAPGYRAWKAGVLAYAERLPQISHGEPAPSDRDPIPPPYNTAYNQPERDIYHVKVKYFRDDRFLVEKMLDEPSRKRLELAWADLLTSFEYHDAILDFTEGKYKLDLKKKGIADLTPADIEALPEEPRKHLKELRASYDHAMRTRKAGERGHIDDCLRLAAKAWRRPLTELDKEGLRSFYDRQREGDNDHVKAVRALIARILVSPAFLYRTEQPAEATSAKPLGGWDLAGRLSFFLWSSVPDDELRRAAASGELATAAGLDKQTRRMLGDPKARRFAEEFFGQWLGFYRFDEHRGIDPGRFPEFTPEVRAAMHDEAVAFFEHVVRRDRPVNEMYFAGYTFLNQPLAKHYGVTKPVKSKDNLELVTGATEFHRGGMLRLGAVLTATSAPLRTSPVKRGDWLLRRVLGTPTPPPPANVPPLPADDQQFGEMSVREKLAAHQRNATCAGCHSRIDPLGFPLERYDPVGRWRESYSDGKAVNDSSPLADGRELNGVDGLLDYIRSQQEQVLRNFARKMLGYALGRTVLPSDRPLIEKIARAGGDVPFSRVVSEIVSSRQFRYRREPAPAQPSKEPVQTASRETVGK